MTKLDPDALDSAALTARSLWNEDQSYWNEFKDEIAAAITAYLNAADPWCYDMEEAQAAGKPILGPCGYSGVQVAQMSWTEDGWWVDKLDLPDEPTAWMPLPPPPRRSEREGGE